MQKEGRENTISMSMVQETAHESWTPVLSSCTKVDDENNFFVSWLTHDGKLNYKAFARRCCAFVTQGSAISLKNILSVWFFALSWYEIARAVKYLVKVQTLENILSVVVLCTFSLRNRKGCKIFSKSTNVGLFL
jgi:hypothetical protein